MQKQQGLAAVWSGGVEGLAAAAAAPSRCFQVTIRRVTTPFHSRTREPHFFPADPHSGTNNQRMQRSGRVERTKRGNSKLEKLNPVNCLLTSSLRRMDCCTPRASPGPAWFGQTPGQTNAGPLSRMTSPISLMTKWRRSSPSGVPAGSGDTQDLHRHCSLCPRQGPLGKLSDFGRTCSDACPRQRGLE